MSAYAYQGAAGYDSNPHGPLHPVNKQPFRQEPASLPPIFSRTGLSSTLLKSEPDPHGQFPNGVTSADHNAGVTGFAPQSNYLAGHSLQNVNSTHPQMLSSMASLSQPYDNYSAQATTAPQSQRALPSVTSMYGQSLGATSMPAYIPLDPMAPQAQPHSQDGIKALASRTSRDMIGHDGQHTFGGSNSPTAATGNLNGVKNADGKWACTLCQKTYQHQKHLKRHNLRHTGERPYRCHLCHETFCRSDILKRHFQKCSVRRGNPQGVTHLTHAQDHLKKPKAESGQHSLSSSAISATPTSGVESTLQARPTWFNQNSMYSNFGSGLPSSTTSVGTTNMDGSNGSSRSSSVPRPSSSGSAGEDRRAHFASSHTLPPMHAPDASPVDSSRLAYDTPYMRTGFSPQGQHNHEQSNAFFGQATHGPPQFAMQQPGHPFPQPGQNPHYQNMAPMNALSNEQWMHDPNTAFHASGHDALMYQGSS